MKRFRIERGFNLRGPAKSALISESESEAPTLMKIIEGLDPEVIAG